MKEVLFINYLSSDTENMKNYKKQHHLFVTTAYYNQPNCRCSLINGQAGKDRFIEGLKLLKEAKTKVNCPVMYLDNDCVLMNRVDPLFDDYDFDVAVVYRFPHETHHGRNDCLGGFLFFSQKRKDAEDQFLHKLITRTEERYQQELDQGIDPWFYDQAAINDIVGTPSRERTWNEYSFAFDYEPCPKDVDGIKVLFISANEWACPSTFVRTPQKVYIFHYNHVIHFKRVKNASIQDESLCCEESDAE